MVNLFWRSKIAKSTNTISALVSVVAAWLIIMCGVVIWINHRYLKRFNSSVHLLESLTEDHLVLAISNLENYQHKEFPEHIESNAPKALIYYLESSSPNTGVLPISTNINSLTSVPLEIPN